MKKLVLIPALLLIVLSSLISQEVITFTNGDWAPFTGKDIKNQGIMSEIVVAAYAEVGYTVKFEWMPWKRAYELAKVAKYDGTIGWAKSEEREIAFNFPNSSILQSKNVFFHRKDYAFDWETYEDLKGIRVGHSLGYGYLGELQKAKEAGILDLDIGDTDEINFRKLVGGRIDIFDCVFIVGYTILADKFTEAERSMITNHPKPISESNYYVIISKTHPKSQLLIDKYDEGLKIIKEKGIYDKILDVNK